MTTEQVRAGLYQRVSTTDQDTARQHAANRAASAAHGWQATEYCDDGIGASSRSHGKLSGANRPGYRAMVADVMAGKLDVLVVHDVSRADRQLETWAPLLAQCRRHGVKVHITGDDETYDPRKANHWRTLATAGINAESESLVKGDQIKSGQAYWRSQGHPMGRLTYGIARRRDPDKIRNRWIEDYPDPATGPTAARIMRAIGAGVPYSQIARDLQADGAPAPRGATWHASCIAKLTRHADAYVRVGLITQDEANDAMARVAATAGMGRGSGAKAQTHRYSGVITCATCQGTLIGSPHSNGSMRYRCRRGCVSIDAPSLDAYVDAWCIARLTRSDASDLISGDDARTVAANARARAAQLRAELDAWVTTPGISPRAYALKEAAMLPMIKAAEDDARKAASVPALDGLADPDPETVGARWESLTVGARKAAVRVLAPHATAHRGRRGGGVTVADRVVMVP